MDTLRLDDLTRLLARSSPRRRLVFGLAASVLGLAGRGSREVAARNRKHKQPRRNAFGCVDVGKPCRGDDRLCCSGICEGKKPKKGKKDRSRCVGHDESTCQAGQRDQDICGGATNVPCITSSGETGTCNTTTGNAPYCIKEADCYPCQQDADCRPFCGPAAACIQCTGCATTGGTACAGPTKGSCEFPD